MRRLLFCLALLFAPAAHAVDVEIGAGVAHYNARGNGMWYQEGFPYKLDLNAPVVEAGLAGNVLDRGRFGLDWHATYVYMGDARSDAVATSDENYNAAARGCRGTCDFQSRFVGHGGLQGLRFTLEPTYTYNRWRFGIEAGVFVYRPRWHVTVYNRPAETDYETTHAFQVAGDTSIRVTPVIGASIGRGNVSLAYLYYVNASSGAPYHSLWNSVHTLTIRYRF